LLPLSFLPYGGHANAFGPPTWMFFDEPVPLVEQA
jgi:hypothetical protein